MNAAPLWIILVADVLISFGGLGMGLSPIAQAGIEAAAREDVARRAGLWRTYGCSSALFGLVVLPAAWTWQAAVSGDWRFVLIGVVPLACALVREPLRQHWAAQARRAARAEADAELLDAPVPAGDRCPSCGGLVVVEHRQVDPDDPDEPPGTTITRCTVCPYRLIHYTAID